MNLSKDLLTFGSNTPTGTISIPPIIITEKLGRLHRGPQGRSRGGGRAMASFTELCE